MLVAMQGRSIYIFYLCVYWMFSNNSKYQFLPVSFKKTIIFTRPKYISALLCGRSVWVWIEFSSSHSRCLVTWFWISIQRHQAVNLIFKEIIRDYSDIEQLSVAMFNWRHGDTPITILLHLGQHLGHILSHKTFSFHSFLF